MLVSRARSRANFVIKKWDVIPEIRSGKAERQALEGEARRIFARNLNDWSKWSCTALLADGRN
jgi:hypothetical protein